MSHDAFISYSRKDKEFARQLHKTLTDYSPPKDLPLPQRRLDVFRDEDDFTGAEYYQSLEHHLQASNKLIVLCSPAARNSQFVNDEIRRFAGTKGAEHIIALLVAGIPNNEAAPEQQAQMAFPDALCESMKMPLAADYRGFDPRRSKVDRGGYEASWFTTLANIYDVSRARIEEREKKRRRARRRLLVLGSAAATVIVLGLSSFGWWQRQDAIQQQRLVAARDLSSRAVKSESDSFSQGLRVRALLAAQSLRTAWTNEGYDAWRRATLRMPPILGSTKTDSLLIKMAFTSDAKRLFALCGQHHVHVFSVPDLQELQKFDASETARELAIDTQGEQLLAYRAGVESIETFQVKNGTKKTVFLPTTFHAAAFNPAHHAIVVSLTKLWVIDAASGDVRVPASFPKATSSVALSPDGATALALTDRALNAYDTANGAIRWQLQLKAGDASRELLFRGDGQTLLVIGEGELLIVGTKTGEIVKSLPGKRESQGRPLLLDGAHYAIGNDLYAMSGDTERVLPFTDERSQLGLPVASPSGRYIAGIEKSEKQNFVVVDTSLKQESVRDDDSAFYLTLEEGHHGTAAAFTADGNILAVSSNATGLRPEGGELQLVSLRPERWRPIIPYRSRTGDLSVLPPDARVVAKHRQSASERTFNADGTPVEDDHRGTFVSASGRFAARREPGKHWVISDTASKRIVTVPDNGSPIEFSPDEQRVLVYPNIYALDDPTSPHTIAGAMPLYRTWSFPRSKLVIGLSEEALSHSDAKYSVLFDWQTGTASAGPGSAKSIYAVSPDGQHFAKYDSGSIEMRKTGHDRPVVDPVSAVVSDNTPLHFSPDGALLAVATCEGPPLYDAQTLKLRFRVPMRGCFAGFTEDSQYVVSRAWLAEYPEPTLHPITLQGVLAETCAKVTHDLSAREQKRLAVAAANLCQDRDASSGERARKSIAQ